MAGKLQIDELDFENIKNNLKTFLSSQSQFKDYDFTGSNLSVILNLLAYNTYYTNLYNNFIANEMFLDTASKRSSIISIAKNLGYTPKSVISSRANIKLSVVPYNSVELSQLVMPKNTVFTATIYDGSSFSFLTLENYIAQKNSSGIFVFDKIELIEGRALIQQYINDGQTRFIIPNQQCDTSTLKVYVNDTNTSDTTVYTLANNFIYLDSTSTVYFINEIENGLYELTFGDGKTGKAIEFGQIITIEYLVSLGAAANGCNTFYLTNSIFANNKMFEIETLSNSYGGSDTETIASIRYNAPLNYYAQNRAVTEKDYEVIIKQNFNNINHISVWGGENNDPPVYGKIFLCIAPKNEDFLTLEERDQIISIVTTKGTVGTSLEIIDPDYLKIIVESTIYYSEKDLIISLNELTNDVKTNIFNYINSISGFNGIFRYSNLLKLIDESNRSIKSNITSIALKKTIIPKYGVNGTYIIKLLNPIYNSGVPEQVVISTGFYTDKYPDLLCYLKDDGVGNLQLYYIKDTIEVILDRSIGSVNYSKGIITITNLNISAVEEEFNLIIKPDSFDIVTARNIMLKAIEADISVNTKIDVYSSNKALKDYNYTSIRS